MAEAVAFAVSLPTDQAHLCAIHPAGNRPVVGQSFPKTDSGQAAALRWLTEADRKGYGIYFNANEVKPLGKGHAKAKEAEVSTVRFLHVDADLPAGTAPDDVETARAELLAKIKAARLTYRKRSISRRSTKVSAASLRTDLPQIIRSCAARPSI